MKTQTQMPPPKGPGVAGPTGTPFYNDKIRELGDRIAKLTQAEADELEEYLKSCGVFKKT